MWTVTILFAGGGSANLIYESEGRANGIWDTLRTLRNPTEDTYAPTATFNDDFGTSVTIDIAEVVCHTLQDLKKVHAGHGEMTLIAQRAQAALQSKMQRDPALRMFMPPAAGGLMT